MVGREGTEGLRALATQPRGKMKLPRNWGATFRNPHPGGGWDRAARPSRPVEARGEGQGSPSLRTWNHHPSPLLSQEAAPPTPECRGAPGSLVRRPRPGRQAEGRKINKQRLMAAVIMAVIMAFIWLPNESHHRQREKLSIARALMNFFANCNQARPSQLAD